MAANASDSSFENGRRSCMEDMPWSTVACFLFNFPPMAGEDN